MDIAETVTFQVGRLKSQIATAVDQAMREFRRETGLSPSRIDINLLDVTSFGSSPRHLVVAQVDITLDV